MVIQNKIEGLFHKLLFRILVKVGLVLSILIMVQVYTLEDGVSFLILTIILFYMVFVGYKRF